MMPKMAKSRPWRLRIGGAQKMRLVTTLYNLKEALVHTIVEAKRRNTGVTRSLYSYSIPDIRIYYIHEGECYTCRYHFHVLQKLDFFLYARGSYTRRMIHMYR